MRLRTLSPFDARNVAPIYEAAGRSVNCENCDRVTRSPITQGAFRGSRVALLHESRTADRALDPAEPIHWLQNAPKIASFPKSGCRHVRWVTPSAKPGGEIESARRVDRATNRWVGRYASVTSRTIQPAPASSNARPAASSPLGLHEDRSRSWAPAELEPDPPDGAHSGFGAAAPTGWEPAGGGRGQRAGAPGARLA